MDYKFRTKPYKHQENIFNKIKDMPNYALLMEQGTGKTKVIIDNFSYLYKKGNIDAVLVVAPYGVHRNWINDEVPKHMPEDIKYKSMFWDNSKSKTKKFQEKFLDLLNDKELCILTCNVESFRVPKAVFNFLTFCRRKNVMMVVEESARIKNPKAKQTREVIKLGNFATYKRILTGTPVTNSPFDVYSQFEFLDKTIIDHSSFYSFKNYYGVFEKKTNWGSNRQYDELKSYRNLDELKSLLDPFSYRITKAECLDLPEKIHTKRYFKLSSKQRDVYDTNKEEFILELDKSQIPEYITKRIQDENGDKQNFYHELVQFIVLKDTVGTYIWVGLLSVLTILVSQNTLLNENCSKPINNNDEFKKYVSNQLKS